jgi:hypothetical protein
LRDLHCAGTLESWMRSRGSYREELRSISFLLADIKVAVVEILSYIRGDDGEEEEDEEDDLPDS